MEQDTLAEILRVEKELREQLDAERHRASEWLAATCRELDAAHQRDLAALQAAAPQGGPGAAGEASQQATQLIREAEAATRSLAGFQDDYLRPVVRRHLAVILPGGAP